jgi:hypothetical protein
MAENRYECLHDALYRFACGPWPPIGQQFKWRTRDEVKRALKWLDQLEREQEREEMEERGRRYRRKAKRAADIVKLVPPQSTIRD